MWPFDTPYIISYRRYIVFDFLYPAVFELLGPKHTLTFQGHVTSSITWRFDSPYRVSYWWCSIGTKSLSPSVFEICGSKVPVQCKSPLRMRDITWPLPLCKIWVHIWISHPHIAYTLWHFYWAPMKIKGCLLVRPPMLNAKSTKIGQILAVLGVWGWGVLKSCNFYPKRHVLAWIHVHCFYVTFYCITCNWLVSSAVSLHRLILLLLLLLFEPFSVN